MSRSRRIKRAVKAVRANKPREFEGSVVMCYRYFQANDDWKTWGGFKMSRARAINAVTEGRAEVITRRCEDGVVRQVGIRWKSPLRPENPSPCVLTLATMKAVSGEFAKGDRPSRAEAAQIAKYAVWPLVFDRKNVCVGAKQTPEQRALAECLLGAHGAKLQSDFERIVQRTGMAA